jgi:hypothetical protein
VGRPGERLPQNLAFKPLWKLAAFYIFCQKTSKMRRENENRYHQTTSNLFSLVTFFIINAISFQSRLFCQNAACFGGFRGGKYLAQWGAPKPAWWPF